MKHNSRRKITKEIDFYFYFLTTADKSYNAKKDISKCTGA
jgi:hypothetical protein